MYKNIYDYASNKVHIIVLLQQFQHSLIIILLRNLLIKDKLNNCYKYLIMSFALKIALLIINEELYVIYV